MHISFILFNKFSNMALACLLEPLRVARDQSGADIRWSIFTEDDRVVTSSSGLTVSPQESLNIAAPSDLAVIIGGDEFRDCKGAALRRNLKPFLKDATLIAGDTGSWLLARAGLLNGRRATIHWQVLEEFAEEFPEIEVLADRFVKDGRFWSCGSAAAALDLMLDYISDRFGPAIAFDAAAMFLHDNARRHGASFPKQAMAQNVSRKLRSVITIMSETLETPHSIPRIAQHVNASERSLRRLFWSELRTTPGRYYLLLRLARARELIRYSQLDTNQIALRCGFANATTLSRSLRANFKADPKQLQ
ncbi:GlxA family transcriptional regulator [Hwanghaeella sp.]|uniref:GlxA family transcriptional regulator n=1 Tax=Hwanghaeella sp. TaxID=2605943 RepID=UPI003CCB9710